MKYLQLIIVICNIAKSSISNFVSFYEVVIEKDCPQFEVKFDESAVTVNPADAAKFVLTKLLGKRFFCLSPL